MIIVVAGVIESEGKILVCQRRRGDTFELMWEFPGGKLEAGETPADGLARELREELGVEAEVGAELFRTEHRYAELSEPIELIFLAATVDASKIRNIVFEQVEWRVPSSLGELNFLPADLEFVAKLARSTPKERLTESLLIITGTMGTGKTAVMGEASDILAQRGIVHAAIDLDALGLAHLPSAARSDGVMYDNLRSVARNYAALGVERFLVARAIEGEAQLKLFRDIIPAANTVVCRLTTSTEVTRRRVEARDIGISQSKYVARAAKLNVILDRAQLEDVTVANENRALTDVALEMLVKAGWISN